MRYSTKSRSAQKRLRKSNLPDRRDTVRGKQWLKEMIEASEGVKSFTDVVDEMQTPLLARTKNDEDKG